MHITETIDRKNSVKFGEFTIYPCILEYPDGAKSVWIEHESGEGAQFHADSLEKVIKEYYNKNF